MPIIGGHLEGLYLGEHAEVGRFGQGDPRFRLAMNLYGAPAMTPQAYASYRQRTIVGISASVAPPLGQYDSSKLINLGTHRWSFKPEIGLSRTYGQWVVEAMAGGWFFTDNTDFLGGRTREQDPIAAVQFHLTYSSLRHVAAGDANFWWTRRSAGSKTSISNGIHESATFSKSLDRSGNSHVCERGHDDRRSFIHRVQLQLRMGTPRNTTMRITFAQCHVRRVVSVDRGWAGILLRPADAPAPTSTASASGRRRRAPSAATAPRARPSKHAVALRRCRRRAGDDGQAIPHRLRRDGERRVRVAVALYALPY